MPDHVVDTNVLKLASDADAGREETPPVTVEDQRKVFDWLVSFRADEARRLVFDMQWRIWSEYRRNMTSQDYGFLVAAWKRQSARLHPVQYDADQHAVLPADLEQVIHDRSDRKFVAVALADEGRSTIVNATDSDWRGWQKALEAAGIFVDQLLER